MVTKLRREEEKAKRSEAIVREAQELLIEEGIGNFSMRDLAKRSRLSVGTIYKYFKNQEEIFLKLAVMITKEMVKLFRDNYNKNYSASKQMKSLIRKYIEYMKKNHQYFKLMTELQSLRYKNLEGTQTYEEFVELTKELIEIMSRILKAGKKDKSFSKDINLTTCLAIIMSIDPVIADFYTRSYQPILEKQYGVTADELTRSYLNLIERIIDEDQS